MEQPPRPSKLLRYRGASDLTEWLVSLNGGEPPVIFPFEPDAAHLLVWLWYNSAEDRLEFGAVSCLRDVVNVPAGTVWFCRVPAGEFLSSVT